MDLQSKLPPPTVYLSTIKTGQLWLFTDVPVFPESWSSTLNVRALPGMNTPYISQGSGDGFSWSFQAKLNPFHQFLSSDGSTSARSPGQIVYQDYLDIMKFIDENGPSPLMVLHAYGREQRVVALQSFRSEMALQQDTWMYDGQLPSIIPVEMTLIEVRDYRVRFA